LAGKQTRPQSTKQLGSVGSVGLKPHKRKLYNFRHHAEYLTKHLVKFVATSLFSAHSDPAVVTSGSGNFKGSLQSISVRACRQTTASRLKSHSGATRRQLLLPSRAPTRTGFVCVCVRVRAWCECSRPFARASVQVRPLVRRHAHGCTPGF
jgi:hypothetical protein